METQISRRNFIGAAAMSFIGSHLYVSEFGFPAFATDTRILELQLNTSFSLDELRKFYERILGFRITSRSNKSLGVQIGDSSIVFSSVKEGAPFYHFAFNIPENKILEARKWQLERTNLVTLGAHLRDPALPEDVVHFRHWNAHSVFFFDPAGNLLEHIARHDLNNESIEQFSANSILNVSEIGLIVDDVVTVSSFLKREVDIPQYKQGSDHFTALGDEQGLILVMKTGRDLGGKKAKTHDVNIKLNSQNLKVIRVPDYPFTLEC